MVSEIAEEGVKVARILSMQVWFQGIAEEPAAQGVVGEGAD